VPSFPGAVKTFTTRNAGDTIQPSHVNDLQDEVNAIEDGYRNATAPLNSSKSTVVSLSVTGNSTLANVNITGGSTLTFLTVANAAALAATQITGTLGVTSGSTLGGAVVLANVIQPAALSTGDTANYNPSGFSSAFGVRLVANSSGSTLSGFHATYGGEFKLLIAASGTVGLKHLAGSSADAQIALRSGSDTVLTVNATMLIWYDATGSVWRQVS
jgi:hypothetical protein